MPSLSNLRPAALTRLATISWLTPAMLRVAVGVTFIGAGWGKLHNLQQVTRYFGSLGIPAASLQAPMVATIELVGGALVLVGLGTRIAAALLTAVMVVAAVTAIWPHSDGVVALLGSLEIVYLLVFAHLVVHGAGVASLDHVIHRRWPVAAATSGSTLTSVTGASI